MFGENRRGERGLLDDVSLLELVAALRRTPNRPCGAPFYAPELMALVRRYDEGRRHVHIQLGSQGLAPVFARGAGDGTPARATTRQTCGRTMLKALPRPDGEPVIAESGASVAPFRDGATR